MSMSIPLGVRLYNNWNRSFDVYVTKWVENIEFRSVIPGGFASATITLHNFDGDLFSQYTRLFTRVQIMDNSQEIVWEGRIEDARRKEEANAWELGCLGSMVIASDVQAPIWFIDNTLDEWRVIPNDPHGVEKDDKNKVIWIRPETSLLHVAGEIDNFGITAGFYGGQRTGTQVGRFDCTYGGNYGSAVVRTGMWIGETYLNSFDSNVDNTAWNAADVRKVNKIVTDWAASQDSTLVTMHVDTTTSAAFTGRGGVIKQPHVHMLRMNENGTELKTAADYPDAFLTVARTVKDVIGRFLVKGWDRYDLATPFAGHCDPRRVFIDSTATKTMNTLTYYDGATAEDIFNDLMIVQPEAYWAFWESNYKATTDAVNEGRFRFEWRKWSTRINYRASIADGIEEQPDGSPVYNFVFYCWNLDVDVTGDMPVFESQNHAFDGGNNHDLLSAQLTRAITVIKETSSGLGFAAWSPGSAAATADAEDIMYRSATPKNTGTLTVKRPIHCWDPGTVAGEGGVSRMLNPWEIRPGKIVQIYDLPPLSQMNNVGALGTNLLPLYERGNTLYRVVATTYSSADNSCVMELDQLQSWDTSTQIVAGAGAKGTLVLRT